MRTFFEQCVIEDLERMEKQNTHREERFEELKQELKTRGDRIKELTDEICILREALKEVVTHEDCDSRMCYRIALIAKEALKQTEGL